MKTCGHYCVPRCIFCIHFAGWREDGKNLVCTKKEKDTKPLDCCKDFHCHLCKDETLK